VLLAASACEDDDDGVLARGADASLLLTAVDGMDVLAALVEPLLVEGSPKASSAIVSISL